MRGSGGGKETLTLSIASMSKLFSKDTKDPATARQGRRIAAYYSNIFCSASRYFNIIHTCTVLV